MGSKKYSQMKASHERMYADLLIERLSIEDISELANNSEWIAEFHPYEKEDSIAGIHGKIFSKKVIRAVNTVRKNLNKSMTLKVQEYLKLHLQNSFSPPLER